MAEPLTIALKLQGGATETVHVKRVKGDWAIHRPLPLPGVTQQMRFAGWNVTHVPTGYRALHCTDLKTAYKVIAALPTALDVTVRANVLVLRDLFVALGVTPGGTNQHIYV